MTVHEIVNKLYKTIPLVPIGNLLQDLTQDVQYGLFKDCGDPNTNWDKWEERAIELLKQRNIISRLAKVAEKIYTCNEVRDIINSTGGKIYSAPYGNYDNKFELKEVNISDINKDTYLTLSECEEYDLDEDYEIIEYLENTYMEGKNLPPVILDSNMKIIDGSHRVGAYENLGKKNIKAFIKIENE